MLNLDPAKLLVILVVALVVLGPERLPQTARQLGSAWRTLTHLREQVTEEVRKAIPDVDLPRIPRVGSVSGFLNDLTRPNPGAGYSSGAPPNVEGRPATRAAETVGVDDPSMN